MQSDLKSAVAVLANELDAFLRLRFRYKSQCARWMGCCVAARRMQFDIYLRVNYYDEIEKINGWPAKSIVVARVGFKQQRCHHGRELVRLLVRLAQRFDIPYIGLEHAHAGDDIEGFARKLGFERLCADCSGDIDGNWLAPVTRLATALKE